MKKILLILLISLYPLMQSFSQTTFPKIVQDSLIVITPQQLKHTNLIFLEHSKLRKQVKLVNDKLKLSNEINSNLEKSIVLKDQEIENYKNIEKTYKSEILINEDRLRKQKRKTYKWMIGGIAVSVTSLILLIVK